MRIFARRLFVLEVMGPTNSLVCARGFKLQTQITNQFAPFAIESHILAHKMSLHVLSLSHLAFIQRIEDLLQSLHGHFSKSREAHLEFTNLVELMETKGNNISRNINNSCILYAITCITSNW